MKINTRKKILNTLQKLHTASTQELSQILGYTRANIHHHLTVLEENALVEVIGKRNGSRGRSVNIYGISQSVLGNGLDILSGVLLEEVFDDVIGSDNEVRLRRLARRLEARICEKSTGSLPKRLTNLVLQLNTFHYQARWEAGATGAKLVFGHCPFSSILDCHPELCSIDAYMIEENIDQEIVQFAKLEHLDSGLTQCVFLVN